MTETVTELEASVASFTLSFLFTSGFYF